MGLNVLQVGLNVIFSDFVILTFRPGPEGRGPEWQGPEWRDTTIKGLKPGSKTTYHLGGGTELFL